MKQTMKTLAILALAVVCSPGDLMAQDNLLGGRVPVKVQGTRDSDRSRAANPKTLAANQNPERRAPTARPATEERGNTGGKNRAKKAAIKRSHPESNQSGTVVKQVSTAGGGGKGKGFKLVKRLSKNGEAQ